MDKYRRLYECTAYTTIGALDADMDLNYCMQQQVAGNAWMMLSTRSSPAEVDQSLKPVSTLAQLHNQVQILIVLVHLSVHAFDHVTTLCQRPRVRPKFEGATGA